MALTITAPKKVAKKKPKAKAKAKAKAKPSVEAIESELNQLGDLYMQLAPVDKAHKKIKKAYAKIFSEVQEWVDDNFDAQEEVELATDRFTAAFAAHGGTTSTLEGREIFDMLEGVQKNLGWDLMGFGVTDLRKYLTPAQFDAVTETAYTRARVTKMVELDDS